MPPTGYPADYAVIVRDLFVASKDGRVHASSIYSIHKRPEYRSSQTQVVVTLRGYNLTPAMEITIQETGVLCLTHQLGSLKTTGCSLGDGGVWLRITSAVCEFWLEIHVPVLTDRQAQAKREYPNH
jgi:hypothetical protein